jgi:ABC-type transporter Mla subunit MlaD
MNNEALNQRLATLSDEVDEAHENVRGVLDALAVLRTHLTEMKQEDLDALDEAAQDAWREEAAQVLEMSRSLLGDASHVLRNTSQDLTTAIRSSTSIRLADLNPVALEPMDAAE